MNGYYELKAKIEKIVSAHYESGMRTADIRAALHAVDLMAEQFGALELMEIAKKMRDEKHLAKTEKCA